MYNRKFIVKRISEFKFESSKILNINFTAHDLQYIL